MKDVYRKICINEKTIPIFSRDWWMDAVCGEENWDVLLVEKNGEIIASMPYYKKKKYGLSIITQPPLTQTNGIWIKYPPGQKVSKKLSYEKDIMNGIIDQLEDLKPDYYCQNFHYTVENWQPFYWRGFQQTTRYTFVIEDMQNIDSVYLRFSTGQRNHIKRASNVVTSIQDNDVKGFYELNKLTFVRQGLNIPYSEELVQRIINVCEANNCGKIWIAKDEKGNMYSTVFIVWDEQSAYLLMSGADLQYRSYHSKSLLIWEAIKYLSTRTKAFDFEGSMIESIAEYNKQFGAIPKPYHQIYKGNRRYKFLSSGNEMLKAILGK